MNKIDAIWRNNTEYLIHEYLSGKSQKDLAKEFPKLSDTHIRNLLKENGIPIRTGGSYKSKVTTNYFKNLNSPETQYWLGWMASDGNVYAKTKSFSLYCNDKEVLDNFKTWCGDDISIYSFTPKLTGNTEYSIKIANKDMYESLLSSGIIPKKSLTLCYTNSITWDFVRGVFEGDGSLSKMKGRLFPRYRFKLCSSSIQFITQLRDFFILEGFVCKVAINSKSLNPNYSISLGSLKDLRGIYAKLYPLGTKYKLERKYDRFTEAINPSKY